MTEINEEDYFQDTRRSHKQDRKAASSKDRSRFKKTDLDKLVKPLSAEVEKLPRGRVISVISAQDMIVDCEGVILSCSLRGTLKQDKARQTNLVTVGDFVRVETKSSVIYYVEPRKTALLRAEHLSQKRAQIIAANIDQVLITVSVVEPSLKPSLIDRYIIATQKGDMVPIIVINKVDRLEDLEFLQELIDTYAKVGVKVILVSAKTGAGLDQLREVMKDRSSVFSGQSGVGKSSLINTMAGSSFRVGDTVGRSKKGSHTTTRANLLPLPFGGFCIDTPGITSFGVWDLAEEEVEHYFDEIHACGSDCKFPDCTHTHEVDCAVRIAAEEGHISSIRFASYIALMESIAEEHKRR